ncbi:Ribonuclease VapC [Rubrivivax sp. A210]|uniref:type II toxin-antitoxin system VapC family toxin n=1 Tax=Rubrivivax sp. A210 TaxID=2772301 RepID=UPI001918C4F3|nr:type II toxin-antitoxin system VapC family toxin [Rubrivivax sp. A210]CAD5371741.1 Ribonuclease VapC [Rubrivivax sp. A210]
MAAHDGLLWLLDTNTISELGRAQPSAQVVQRFTHEASACALAAVVWHELWFGVLRLPTGRRRDGLTHFVRSVAGGLPKLPYTEATARKHAELRAQLAAKGRILPEPDAHIAAVAITHGLTLVTRNTRDFKGLPGLQLANWFQD